jgi:hypothetical protein
MLAQKPVLGARPASRASCVQVRASWQKATTKTALKEAGGKVVSELGGQVGARDAEPLRSAVAEMTEWAPPNAVSSSCGGSASSRAASLAPMGGRACGTHAESALPRRTVGGGVPPTPNRGCRRASNTPRPAPRPRRRRSAS